MDRTLQLVPFAAPEFGHRRPPALAPVRTGPCPSRLVLDPSVRRSDWMIHFVHCQLYWLYWWAFGCVLDRPLALPNPRLLKL